MLIWQKEIRGLVLYSRKQGQPAVKLKMDIAGGISGTIGLQYPE